MEECGYYTSKGEVCQFTSEDIQAMVKHISSEHGAQEANEYLDKEG